jgi:Dephospho-CoA kinase
VSTIVVTGLSGVGKTTATRFAAERGYLTISVGDIVREEYDPSKTESIAEFNTRIHTEHGDDYFTQLAIERLYQRHDVNEHDDVVIDSIQTVAARQAVSSALGPITIVWIHSPVADRVQRLRQRDMNPLTHEELLQRDLRELNYGLASFATPFGHDVCVTNDTTLEEFTRDIRAVL